MNPANYDWLATSGDQAAMDLRDGSAPVGAIRFGHWWTWGCRCGAWEHGLARRKDAREAYADHRVRCPLRMGLIWNPALRRWQKPQKRPEVLPRPQDGMPETQ